MKTTETEPERLLLVAVMCAVPARVDVMTEVAIPLVVVRGVSTLPMLDAKATLVPSATRLLY